VINKISCLATRHGGVWRGERRYNSYSFLTSALDGGEWSASRPGRALPPGKGPPVPIEQEAGWAPEPVWTQGLEEKSSASVGDRTPIVQPVVKHKTDWATADPNVINITDNFLNRILDLFSTVDTVSAPSMSGILKLAILCVNV
jgi:hypothetical protein